ncbi:unnamed protein product [Closterium sp. NIES-53]
MIGAAGDFSGSSATELGRTVQLGRATRQRSATRLGSYQGQNQEVGTGSGPEQGQDRVGAEQGPGRGSNGAETGSGPGKVRDRVGAEWSRRGRVRDRAGPGCEGTA